MKKLSIFVITLLMFTSVAVVLTSIINNKSANKLNQGIDVYYINTDGAGLKGETYNIIGNSTDDILKNTIELMKVKAKNEKLISAVPEDVELIGSSVEGDIARLNFSSEYYDMKKSDEMYCRGAVIKTVTGLYFVDKVEILVEGEPLKQTNGDPIGPVGSDDLIISGTIEAEPATSVKVITLYFANADGTGLNKEERRVEVNRSQPLEKYVMEGHFVSLSPDHFPNRNK